MFTGIVQARGRVATIDQQGPVTRVVIDPQGWQPAGRPLTIGDSICISGVCLTVVEFSSGHLSFDVIQESLDKSTLGLLQPDMLVNLESAVTPATPLGGHFMQGHVDTTANVVDIKTDEDDRRITFKPNPILVSDSQSTPIDDAMDAIVPKGSIALDGVSLTIASVSDQSFDVALIPITLEHTTMGQLNIGDRVNIELDVISKTVVHWLARQRR